MLGVVKMAFSCPDFSPKENTFGVGFRLGGPTAKQQCPGKTFGVAFKLRRPPAKLQCPRSQRQPRSTLALGEALGQMRTWQALLP